MHKVWLRKAKCHDELHEKDAAIAAYKEALNCLSFADVEDNIRKKKISEIQKCMQAIAAKPQQSNAIVKRAKHDFQGGKVYVSAHSAVAFDEDDVQGRYAIAARDIELGTIIIEEDAHCAVLISEKVLSNCQHCLLATIQPVACTKCDRVIFCSLKCAEIARETYHKYECNIQPTVFQYGASINCSMALRIITQRNLQFFNDIKSSLDKPHTGKSKIYTSDSYKNMYHLCRNENHSKKEHLVHYSCMAVFLLRLLKISGYFGNNSNDSTLSEDEAFIGSLILRHLQALQFNAHEISELSNIDLNGDVINYQSDYIGGGVYPTLALFNHSCDPSIVRYVPTIRYNLFFIICS